MYQVVRTMVYTYDTAEQALKDQERWAVPPNGYGPAGVKRTIRSSVTPIQDIGGGSWPDEYTQRHFDAFGQMSGEQQTAHLTEHHDEPVARGLLRRSDVIDHHIERHRRQQRAEQEQPA